MSSPKQTKKRSARHEALAGIRSMSDVLAYAGPPAKAAKGPYGARLSDALAMLIANLLRPDFDGILPSADGRGHESRARTAKGYKKLDINYSTLELGLALGVSLKTINYRDPETNRYTKNYSRVDNELRAEAMDYHQRQPYAVLVGMLFLPIDACDDAGTATASDETGVSSFGAAVRYFRNRIPRPSPGDPTDMFERFFVGLYSLDPKATEAVFYDVSHDKPPRARRPKPTETQTLADVIAEIKLTYDSRNNRPFHWASE